MKTSCVITYSLGHCFISVRIILFEYFAVSTSNLTFGTHNADPGDRKQQQKCNLQGCLVIAPRLSRPIGMSLFLVRTQEINSCNDRKCAPTRKSTHTHTHKLFVIIVRTKSLPVPISEHE
jgi:hypothetical protein